MQIEKGNVLSTALVLSKNQIQLKTPLSFGFKQ